MVASNCWRALAKVYQIKHNRTARVSVIRADMRFKRK